ncbi:MAG: hypothetical protein J7M14_00740, partial [Planctomycetes bacterium]|nr:hypothetical protein [Planctomycetota bacterium]
TAAKILNHAGYASEKVVLDTIAGDQPDLADSILKRMFEFDDIVTLSNDRLSAALADCDPDEIAVALRTSTEQVKQKILSSLPNAQAERVREEMDNIGAVRLSDVEAAQRALAGAVRRTEAGRYVSADLPQADLASDERGRRT